MNNKNKPLS